MTISETEDWKNGGFGVYVHWPFCAAKCPYCDFNSHVSKAIDEALWQSAYMREIDRTADLIGPREVNSIFFGGGTPSLMSPSLVGDIIKKIASRWAVSDKCEITLEANPTSVESQKLSGFRAAGVNRLSMGIQSLNDTDLKRLGRLHTAAEALQAFEIARKTFDKTSFDLIYARQNQTLDQWKNELNHALSLGLDHMSLYQLTIESGTAFGDLYKSGRLKGLPDDDLACDLYEITQELCEACGLSSYEVSNHATPASECRHNLVYWNCGDYAGIGPGAHGRLSYNNQRYATETVLQPNTWLETVLQGSDDVSRSVIPLADQASELLLMGLRLSGGISLKRLKTFFPNLDVSALATGQIQELAIIDEGRLKTTARGRMVLNHTISQILSILEGQ